MFKCQWMLTQDNTVLIKCLLHFYIREIQWDLPISCVHYIIQNREVSALPKASDHTNGVSTFHGTEIHVMIVYLTKYSSQCVCQ